MKNFDGCEQNRTWYETKIKFGMISEYKKLYKYEKIEMKVWKKNV